MAGGIHLFKITGMLTPEKVKLKRNILWDIIELYWKEVNVTLIGNKINLPTSVTIKFRDKFKIRHTVKGNPCFLYNVKARHDLVLLFVSNNPHETA